MKYWPKMAKIFKTFCRNCQKILEIEIEYLEILRIDLKIDIKIEIEQKARQPPEYRI